MMNRFTSVVAIVGLAMAGAACQSSGWSGSAQYNDQLGGDNIQGVASHNHNEAPTDIARDSGNDMSGKRAIKVPGATDSTTNQNSNIVNEQP